jgi:hypothetical protein
MLHYALWWKILEDYGHQFIAWGVIDTAFAIGGQITSNERIDNYENAGRAEIKQQEVKTLSRLLWSNAVLDIFYILGGLWWSKRDRGNGLGVFIQGAFLLFFDSLHALKMPKNHDE